MWQHIVRQEGMRSLFKGAAYPITTIALQVNGAAMYLLCLQSAVVFYLHDVVSTVPAGCMLQ